MIHGKKPKFGTYRKKSLLSSGMTKKKDEKDWQFVVVKLKCDECNELATTKYIYQNWFVFFGKEKPEEPNSNMVVTEECENCGAIYILDQLPDLEQFTGRDTHKSRLGQHGSGPSDPDKIYPGIKFDVYDDGDYLIK